MIFISIHLVSSSLTNQINSHLFTLPTNPTCGVPLVIENEDDCEKIYESGWSSITVKEGYCNSLTGNLIISDNNCLQYIHIHFDVLSNIQSVEISNVTNLSLIRMEYSFYHTTSLTLSSTFYFMTVNQIFLILKNSLLVIVYSMKLLVLLWKVHSKDWNYTNRSS